ncbi:hypothetical protein HRE53_07970 [Acaryochloris sp. 'Moss Beach']|uniref:hypothetical protein n=1 Tax=Acaryochloris sp. 'Moss Beach' TaxID=2740837 RepID=UPI001F3005B6|nr:hypothetical protein [Acaryochloris sp. 'Moss Beach']UJB70956.1 hypothetical protein HRE53_07970 [Acaryochloris sp. 'Moss Beach']
MKLVNPLYFPLAILAGGIVLVGGVRIAKLNSFIMLPLSVGVATVGAGIIAPESSKAAKPKQRSPAVEQELGNLRTQANKLAQKAQSLKTEAQELLTQSLQMELLGTLQYACDRTTELPQKIETMAERLHGDDSILSVQELQQQRVTIQKKLAQSSGATQQQLQQLDQSLQRNISLAQQGQDARQAQLLSLSQLIAESAGVLQAMQNQLRSADLAEASQSAELKNLSDELRDFQENLDVLVLT